MFSATYSPEDNKLRLYAAGRLDKDTYQRVRSAGFIWAPKQELFVAPMWTPAREDLLIELAGEVGDEDTSLVDRAEQRADRFSDYSQNRADDAERAHAAVAAIADNIPLGQPILVGHHSEKHARRDAEKIENGMRKAVRMWDQAQYWKQRAAGAIRAAKYKERPDVRARRIKGLEADKRKQERYAKEAESSLAAWEKVAALPEDQQPAAALRLAGGGDAGYLQLPRKEGDKQDWQHLPTAYDGLSGHYPTLYAPRTVAEVVEAARKAYPATIAHAQRWIAHYDNRLAYERAMMAESGGTAADQVGPEKGGACQCWAGPRGGWAYIQKVNKVSVTILDNWGNGGGNFTRTIPFDKLAALMTAAQVQAARSEGRLFETEDKTGFYLRETSGKTEPDPEAPQPGAPDEAKAKFEALRDNLEAGVQVVSSPQLFPTPPDIAKQVVELAEIEPEHRVLEPSAGTGALLRAIGNGPDKVAVEINPELVKQLMVCGVSGLRIHEADFLSCNGDLGTFDRIVMNPPFKNGEDIKHILHARHMLKPGGRLVAICANGPRQQEQLQPLADAWIDLPAGSFKESGTNVNTAIVVLSAE